MTVPDVVLLEGGPHDRAQTGRGECLTRGEMRHVQIGSFRLLLWCRTAELPYREALGCHSGGSGGSI